MPNAAECLTQNPTEKTRGSREKKRRALGAGILMTQITDSKLFEANLMQV
jgi:hypothetical protein